jgi:hypothetical protein
MKRSARTCSTTCPKARKGRRWRALLSEAQVVLHQHPVNAQRARGQAAGEFAVVLGRRRVAGSRDDVACAIASDEVTPACACEVGACRRRSAGARFVGDGPRSTCGRSATCAMATRGLQPAIDAMRAGDWRNSTSIAKTAWIHAAPPKRWRFWRKPLAAFDA